MTRIDVCVCTFKRPELLQHCLEGLIQLEAVGFEFGIVIADNDRDRSAEPVAKQFKNVRYCVEPEQNIARARNKALENATGDFVAFLDDDEIPAKDWLVKLFKACDEYGADGVLGPVVPFFENEPPAWVIRGGFCDRPRYATGTKLTWRETRTGNVLFRRQMLQGIREPFRPEFGNGGEDQDFFNQMMQTGKVFVWCDEAIVREVVPPERWRRRYMLKRGLLRGQNEYRFLTVGSVVTSLVAVLVYSLALPFLLLFGQHLFMKYFVKLCDHLGKLMGAIGIRPLGEKYLNV